MIDNPCFSPFYQKTSFRTSKWPRKLKTAKNSKLPKLPENCFEPVGKGGWPPISIWITVACFLPCPKIFYSPKYCGHVYQRHSIAKDLALSIRQSKATPAPRQVAHSGPNSVEISSSDGGTQRNGENLFLSREDLSRWILVATHLLQLAQNNFLSILAIYYF